MKKREQLIHLVLGVLSFLLPFILYIKTAVNALMFDDAAEFALVIKLGSIAHPPGTPSYIFLGGIWTKITSLFGNSTIPSLNAFSAFCISLSCLLLYLSFTKISEMIISVKSPKNNFISFLCAIGFGTAATTWAWANTIEVYAFQAVTMAILLFGLISFQKERKKSYLIIGGIGIGLGLSAHHLTMIMFLPFSVFFLIDGLFTVQEAESKKKKVKERSFIEKLISTFKSKDFFILSGTSAIVMIFFYGWMYIRAQQEYPFMFGQPNTLDLLFYHLKGGSYGKNLTSASTNVISSRFPYFIKLTALQLFVFLPFLFLGFVKMIKSNLKVLSYSVLFYYLFLFIYQLNNNQWSSTDAYLLLPFMVLTIPVFIGCLFWLDKFKLQFVLPILIILQVAYNFKDHDRRDYTVSTSLMKLLDDSSPKNSVILISDWSTLIQYYYFRILENFRTDLVVLNYDMKFTHYRILPVLYPDFYQKVKPEYDRYISELAKEHPDQITNTGCDLTTEALQNDFRILLLKTQSICKEENRNFLTDPKAHYFFSNQKFYDPRRYVSGCFNSTIPGDSLSSATFLKMDFPFLSSQLLLNDPSSLDKLVDFQAMLDSHISFYNANNDTVRSQEADIARDKILKIQRELKKSMSFAYQLK